MSKPTSQSLSDAELASASRAIPDLPYVKGFRAEIRRHVPPEPYRAYPYEITPLGLSCLPKVPQVKAVLQIPPREAPSCNDSANHSDGNLDVHNMEVLEVIAGGPDRDAQVVRCTIRRHESDSEAKQQPSFEAVAKIYDPLYYAPKRLHPLFNCCEMHKADGDYSREAAAYETLRDARHPTTGIYTPQYHDSWTFAVPHPQLEAAPEGQGHSAASEVQRPVRMILIEYLNGCTLHSLMFDKKGQYIETVRETYHESYRLYTWAKLLEAEAFLKDARLRNDDDTPRNVMLVPRPIEGVPLSAQATPRVVLIDFNQAYAPDRVKLEGKRPLPPPASELPDSPLQKCWGLTAHDYKGWVPEWYEKDGKKRDEWLLDQFARGNASRWRPLFRNHRIKPARVPWQT